MTEASPSAAKQGNIYDPQMKRESGISAFIQVAIVAILVGGALFWYYQDAQEKKRVNELSKKAFEAKAGDDAPALLKAKALYEETGKVESDERILAHMAELTSQLYFAYGMTELKGEAERYVQLAKSEDIKKAERYAAEAYLMAAQGDAKGAETLIKGFTDKGIRHGKLLHALSVSLLAQGRGEEAQAAAEAGMKLTSGLVRLPLAQGDALLVQGSYSAARNAYRRALAINGNHIRARTAIHLANIIGREGNPKLYLMECDKLLAEAKEIHQDKPPPRTVSFLEYTKGEAFLADGDAKTAVAQADKALAIDAALYQAHALKGRAFAREKKLNETKAAFDKALELAPSSVPVADDAFMALKSLGKVAEGAAFLQKVQEANPDNGHVYVKLAMALADAGQGAEALKSAETAIEKLGNGHELALFAKGRALQTLKKNDDARAAYKEAVEIKGGMWGDVWFELANMSFSEKDYGAAISAFDEAAKAWDKEKAPVEKVASAYESAGKSYEAMGGRKNKKKAQRYFDKARRTLSQS
jgi:tetratricopeptide (TPR) repeat protein